MAVVSCPLAFTQTNPQLPAGPPGPTLTGNFPTLTLQDAMTRARQYSQQVYTTAFAALIAHEDTVQAKAALLPNVSGFSQFIYTMPNGTPSGAFVSNDGPHVYNDQVIVHGEIYNPVKLADYQRLIAAEAVARAKADLAVRGLVVTVVQNYYGMLVSQRKLANAQQSLTESQSFLDITRKQEQGGEAAHVDVVKAQILVEQRQRDVQDAVLNLQKARIGFGVLLFPNYGQQFAVADDLENPPRLPAYSEVQNLATRNSPDLRAATATVRQETYERAAAHAALLPSLSFDYFAGINANQFALYNRDHLNNLGYVAQAQLTVPIWTWGANRSRERQAQLRLQQAQTDLTLTQRTLYGEIDSSYLEAQAAVSQLDSLRSSAALSGDNLRLTLLRYQAGEATAQEVVDAQTTLTQARNAVDDGLLRYRLAVANIQTLTGVF